MHPTLVLQKNIEHLTVMDLSSWPRDQTSTWDYRQIHSQHDGTMDLCLFYLMPRFFDGAFPAAHNIDVWAVSRKWLCIHIIRKVAQADNLCVQLLHDCVNDFHRAAFVLLFQHSRSFGGALSPDKEQDHVIVREAQFFRSWRTCLRFSGALLLQEFEAVCSRFCFGRLGLPHNVPAM